VVRLLRVHSGHIRSPQVEKETQNFLIFQDKFDILPVAKLLEIRLSDVIEQKYIGLYGKFQIRK
jgi:hypothetical protein